MAVRVLVFPTDFRRFSTTAAASGSEIAPAHAPRHLSKPVALPPRPPSAPSASHRCRGGSLPLPLTRARGFHGLTLGGCWNKKGTNGLIEHHGRQWRKRRLGGAAAPARGAGEGRAAGIGGASPPDRCGRRRAVPGGARAGGPSPVSPRPAPRGGRAPCPRVRS